MATPANQLDQLIATTYDRYRPALADQITKETSLLAALNLKSQVVGDGGLTIRRPVMYALNSTVASYNGYDLIDTTPQGGFGYAEYQWRQVAGALTIDGRTERINSGPAEIINLLQAKFDQLRLSFENTLTTMLWADGTGNGGKDVMGLDGIVNNSGILGGIDSSTETWWQSVVNSTGGTFSTVGLTRINNTFNSLSINGSRPDFEFTTQALFEGYEALASVNIRFTQTAMADLGFEALAHKTAEVVFEPGVPTQSWFFINSAHLEFVQHREAWLLRKPFVEPANQDARVAKVLCMGNLVTDMRRAHGKATGLT